MREKSFSKELHRSQIIPHLLTISLKKAAQLQLCYTSVLRLVSLRILSYAYGAASHGYNFEPEMKYTARSDPAFTRDRIS